MCIEKENRSKLETLDFRRETWAPKKNEENVHNNQNLEAWSVVIYGTNASTNLQKLILCGVRELFIKCILQHLGNETHSIAADE